MEYRDNRKSSFMLYYPSTEQLIENFTDEEIGKVFRAVAKYEMYGEVPPDDCFTDGSGKEDRALKMVFTSICGELDRNNEKYAERCEQNKRNRNAYKEKADESKNYDERMKEKESALMKR